MYNCIIEFTGWIICNNMYLFIWLLVSIVLSGMNEKARYCNVADQIVI